MKLKVQYIFSEIYLYIRVLSKTRFNWKAFKMDARTTTKRLIPALKMDGRCTKYENKPLKYGNKFFFCELELNITVLQCSVNKQINIMKWEYTDRGKQRSKISLSLYNYCIWQYMYLPPSPLYPTFQSGIGHTLN
jgi:hypothetical protein